MLKVGLTGGIASGKTAASQEFANCDAPIIDADIITHEIMQPGNIIYQKIIDHFGSHIVDQTGKLNRREIANIIFTTKNEKQWLENLIHPVVRETMQNAIDTLNAPYCILVIPLLIETLPNPLVERILVIDCDPALQLKRLQAREHLSKQQAQQIMVNQIDRQQRLEYADDIITNDSDIFDLKTQVNQLHNYYLEIAK